jgi:hypothetical protein
MEYPNHLIDLLLAVITGVGGWFLRMMWEAVASLRKDVGLLEASLPKVYVMREDYRDDIRELKDMVAEIWAEMKSKQDKPHAR